MHLLGQPLVAACGIVLQQIEQLLGRPIERRKLDGFRYYSEPQLTPGGPKAAVGPRKRNR